LLSFPKKTTQKNKNKPSKKTIQQLKNKLETKKQHKKKTIEKKNQKMFPPTNSSQS
jgi:hypothetical protein